MDRSRVYLPQREPGTCTSTGKSISSVIAKLNIDDRQARTKKYPNIGVIDPNEPTPNYSTQRKANGRVQSQAPAENRRQRLKKYSVVIVAGEGVDLDEQSQVAMFSRWPFVITRKLWVAISSRFFNSIK